MMPPPLSPGGASLATISPNSAAPVSRKVEMKARDDLETGNPPDAGTTPNPPDAGADCPLPAFSSLVWERDRDGGWEAWHAPQGRRTPRRLKTYLGRVGKRKLAEWERLADAERLATISVWVADRRKGKGI